MIKRYEAELGKRDRRFRDMGEIAGEWIWELDSKMRFTYANRKIKEITGYAPEEVVGKTPVELMPSSKAVEIRLYMDVLINSPKPFLDLEHTILHRDGTCRIMKVNGIPLYGHNNEFIGYRGVCSDMP